MTDLDKITEHEALKKRVERLEEALTKLRSIIDDGEEKGISSWSVLSAVDHEIDCARAALEGK